MIGRAFLSLGSNIGDRWRYLSDAVETLGASVVGVSPVYETDPVGGPDQGRYLNIVIEIATGLSPRALLAVCHRLEAAANRVRSQRWGPRTLDVDILLMDKLSLDEPDLQIPHPRMHERRFVLAPLADLAPELVTETDLEHAEGVVESVGYLPGWEPSRS